MWILVHGGTLTNDSLQRRRPLRYLNPQWCIMCCKSGESLDHLFLHCSVARQLWHMVFGLGNVVWVAPKGCAQMLLFDFQTFGRSKRAKVLWSGVISAIFWVAWMERNARVFEGVVRDIDYLWDRARYLASFWTSASSIFRGIPLFFIAADWVSVCTV
ncbi:hypothetical protein CsSME_00041961 [Camellia sinensis var. sinensis]